ncbi:MAG: hypothetical protein U0797_22560 [Gemmataceae bacterium]
MAVIGGIIVGLLLAVVVLAVSMLLIWRAKGRSSRRPASSSRHAKRVALAERGWLPTTSVGTVAPGAVPERYRGWVALLAAGVQAARRCGDAHLYRIAVSPDGKRLVVPRQRRGRHRLGRRRGARLQRLPGHQKKFADRVAFSPDGGHFRDGDLPTPPRRPGAR